jgi:hypothetical protein
MTKVFQCDVWRIEAPSVHVRTGELVDVAGNQMVRMAHGAIVPIGRNDRWYAAVPDAKRDAAAQVDAAIVELHGLAARLRAEADAEEAKGGAA